MQSVSTSVGFSHLACTHLCVQKKKSVYHRFSNCCACCGAQRYSKKWFLLSDLFVSSQMFWFDSSIPSSQLYKRQTRAWWLPHCHQLFVVLNAVFLKITRWVLVALWKYSCSPIITSSKSICSQGRQKMTKLTIVHVVNHRFAETCNPDDDIHLL